MDLKTIDVGAAANNRRGTPLRTALGWINDNFAAVVPALNGKVDRGRTAVAAALYQAQVTDTFIAVTTLAAPCTIPLPPASAFPEGQTLYVADETGACSSTLSITITAVGDDTIAGQASVTMGSPYQKLAFHSNGSNLWTVA